MGAITTSAVTSIKWQEATSSSMGDAADLKGTGMTIADSDDNEQVASDLFRPSEQYVRIVCDRATANAVVEASYIQYKAKDKVTSQGSGVTAESHVTPAQGTA